MSNAVQFWSRLARLVLIALATCWLVAAGPAAAADGPVALVKDFSSGTRDSNPSPVVVAGGVGYFSANPTGRDSVPQTANELFRTDGTEAGTQLVKELVPGEEGAVPQDLTAIGTTLFFVATSARVPQKLWQTDGTEAGTVPAALDPAPGKPWSAEIVGVRAGELLVVTTTRGAAYADVSNVLWALRPGTAARQLATLPRAPIGDATLLTDGHVLFARYATTTDAATELWTTASNEGAEPRRLARFAQPGGMGVMHVSGAKVYFAGVTAETGSEPWVSDGTEGGTKLVGDLTPGAESTDPGAAAAVGDDLYLTRLTSGLLRTSGGQTTELRQPGSDAAFDVPTQLTAVGKRLCFVAGYDPGVWCTDGTQGGTARLLPGEVRSIERVGDTLYFSQDGQLWQSDGTVAGTRIYAAVREGAAPYGAEGFTRLGTQLLFTASDPVRGRELWRSDGTDGGTALVRDLATTPLDSPITSLPSRRGKAYFTATDRSGAFGLWRSDGTTDGTALVRLLPAGAGARDGVLVGSRILFKLVTAGDGENHVELWQTDGTASGTRLIPRPTDVNLSEPSPLVPVGSRVIFDASTDDGIGRAVYAYDTAKRRFTKLRSRTVTGDLASVDTIVATRGAAYFQGYDPRHGLEVWRTDGTARGTARLLDATPGRRGSAAPVAATAGRVFFTTDPQWGTAPGEAHTQVLWSSAGTARTTRRLRKLVTWQERTGNSTPRPSAIAGPDGLLLYSSAGGEAGARLWATDGSRRGTRPLSQSVSAGVLEGGVVLGHRVWFTAGGDLASSDGTAAGTRRVTTSPSLFAASGLIGRGDRLFFGHGDDTELWTVDGPTDNPRLVQDLWPGSQGSSPGSFMLTTSHLLFTADNGASGRQLYGMAISK